MHHEVEQQIQQVVAAELVGQMQLVAGGLFDCALGRVALPRLDPSIIKRIVARLGDHFGEVRVRDHLHLSEADRPLRGLVEVFVLEPALKTPYLLQLSHFNLLAFHQRRFELDQGLEADLLGSLCQGLERLMAIDDEPALRRLSGFAQLRARYGRAQTELLRAAVDGARTPALVHSSLADVAGQLRELWRVIPEKLRARVTPLVSGGAGGWLARADERSERAMVCVLDGEQGQLVYEYRYDEDQPYGEVERAVGVRWAQLVGRYQPPQFTTMIARARSSEQIVAHFPGLQPALGRVDAGPAAPSQAGSTGGL